MPARLPARRTCIRTAHLYPHDAQLIIANTPRDLHDASACAPPLVDPRTARDPVPFAFALALGDTRSLVPVLGVGIGRLGFPCSRAARMIPSPCYLQPCWGVALCHLRHPIDAMEGPSRCKSHRSSREYHVRHQISPAFSPPNDRVRVDPRARFYHPVLVRPPSLPGGRNPRVNAPGRSFGGESSDPVPLRACAYAIADPSSRPCWLS